jgi:formate dehydrogenase accessory protein FdhD
MTGRSSERTDDALAVERPLEIRVGGRALSVTLRTPGHDEDLVTGFLAAEGVIRDAGGLASVSLADAACDDEPDTADVTLAPGVALDWSRLERHFSATSACGLCGRAHLESLRAGLEPVAPGPPLSRAGLLALPERLRPLQHAFRETGGLHAAVWCDGALEPRVAREDVGRHNAVDKVVGARLREGSAAGPGVLWVSGRAGAELVLKAARAGLPALAAVGAPSTLAVDLARAARMTLVGFLREGRMNVYAGEERVAEA